MPSLVLREKGSTATLSPWQKFTNSPDENGTCGIGQSARGRAVLAPSGTVRVRGLMKGLSRSGKLSGHLQHQPVSEEPESFPSQLPWIEAG